ncbi:MAG: hypothetical protein M1819_003456 [Sarea resinae]|nr:MAG: hypothetical protein M1819_003456 [Sarea resinae]
MARIPLRLRIAIGCFSLLVLLYMIRDFWPEKYILELPAVSVQYESKPYNESKVALLVETRALPQLAPFILHMISVVPPDWRFRFMGSNVSIPHLNNSVAIRHQVEIGKLDLTYVPSNVSVDTIEHLNEFYTNLWVYETVLQPAEWILSYQTDSMLCANSKGNLNDWLEYDWVGAPWSLDARYGGNGGLSLRRASAIIQVLRNQRRLPNSDPEDVWLSERLGHRRGGSVANGTASLQFSAEQHWTEYPMGYHTGGSGIFLSPWVWGTPAMRQHIYDYCPEIKLVLDMDVASYMPGECGLDTWKRDENALMGDGDY